MTHRVLASAAAFAVGAGLMVAAAPAASASTETCPSNSICLYYNSNYQGSFENFSPLNDSICRALGNYRFTNYGNGSGYNQGVEDNTASVVNNTSDGIIIYTLVSDCGSSVGGFQDQTIPAGGRANLVTGVKNLDVSMTGE